jgi:hypothetical protein
MSTHSNECPCKCSGRSHDRQRDLTPNELESIPEPSRTTIKTATQQARKCGYCGCVYDFGGRIFGWVDDAFTGKPWTTSQRP